MMSPENGSEMIDFEFVLTLMFAAVMYFILLAIHRSERKRNGEGLPVIGEYLEKIAYHANDMCEVLMNKKKQESPAKQSSVKSTRSMAISKREKTKERTSKELPKNVKTDERQHGVSTDGKEPGDSKTSNKELGQADNPTASLAARNLMQKKSVFGKLPPDNLGDLFASSPDVIPAHAPENNKVKKNKSSQRKGRGFPVFRPHEYVSEKFERVSKPPAAANEIDKKEHKHHRNHLPAAIPPTN